MTGSTSNYTVNLSGIVLLSLSLSAAVMLWGYLYTLFERNKNKGSTSNQDSYSGGGGYYKVNNQKYVGRTIFIVMQNEKERLGPNGGRKA